MSRIRGRDTGPELALRRAAWKAGLRYRLNHSLPGKPDLVFVKAKVAIFVDGCFWHGCPEHSVKPQTNSQFWEKKLRRNIERDREVNERLAAGGWTVLRFWEHDVTRDVVQCVEDIRRHIPLPLDNNSKKMRGESPGHDTRNLT